MSLENALLCAIVGAPLSGEHGLGSAAAEKDAAPWARALALSHIGSIDGLRRLIRTRSDVPVDRLATYGLFIGLTCDPERARTLFRLLLEVAPLNADVWLGFARFEAAIGNGSAALRAVAIHADLTGGSVVNPSIEDAAPFGITSGRIRIFRGDVDIDL